MKFVWWSSNNSIKNFPGMVFGKSFENSLGNYSSSYFETSSEYSLKIYLRVLADIFMEISSATTLEIILGLDLLNFFWKASEILWKFFQKLLKPFWENFILQFLWEFLRNFIGNFFRFSFENPLASSFANWFDGSIFKFLPLFLKKSQFLLY